MISKRYDTSNPEIVWGLPDNGDGLREWMDKEKDYHYTNCPCGSRNAELLARRDRYGIPVDSYICTDCGIIYFSPMYSESTYLDYYRNHYRKIYTPATPAENFENQYNTAKKFFSNFTFGKDMTLLEVGCGAGGSLKYLKEIGVQAKGIDLDRESIDYAESKGVDVDLMYLSHVQGIWDMVFFNHSFEHILDPIAELHKAYNVLGEKGILIIRWPSVFGVHKYYEHDLLAFIQDAHPFSYTMGNLTNLANRAGFSLLMGDNVDGWAIFNKSQDMEPERNDYRRVMEYLCACESMRERVVAL